MKQDNGVEVDENERGRRERAVAKGEARAREARARRSDTKAWFAAAENGDAAAIKHLLSQGVDVNVQNMEKLPSDRKTSTALCCAIRAGSRDCVIELLSANPSQEHLAWARRVAIYQGQAELFRALVRHRHPGANPWETLEHHAQKSLDLDHGECLLVIAELIGGKECAVGTTPGNTWLHEAAWKAAPNCVKVLLDKCDAHAINQNGQTALMLAVCGGRDRPWLGKTPPEGLRKRQAECVQALLAGSSLAAVDKAGRAALDLARDHGCHEAAALIEAAEMAMAASPQSAGSRSPQARL